MHGRSFKKRSPWAIKSVVEFASKTMGTSDVRIDPKLNEVSSVAVLFRCSYPAVFALFNLPLSDADTTHELARRSGPGVSGASPTGCGSSLSVSLSHLSSRIHGNDTSHTLLPSVQVGVTTRKMPKRSCTHTPPTSRSYRLRLVSLRLASSPANHPILRSLQSHPGSPNCCRRRGVEIYTPFARFYTLCR